MSVLSRWLARSGDERPVVRDIRGVTTWSQAIDAADRVAHALLDGRRSLDGERVALLASPGAEFVSCMFGVFRAGGCLVVLSPLHPFPETAYFCADAQVKTVLASPDRVGTVASLAPEHRIVTTDALLARSPSQRSSPAAIAADPRDDDAALQLYTSGTTGKPKGAVITHRNLAMQQELLAAAWAWRPEDELLHVLPLHHLHGLAIALLSAIGAAATTHFVPFEPRAVWEAMPSATVFMGVPTVHAKLLAALDDADRPTQTRWSAGAQSLRLITSGSAALPVTVGERWRTISGAYPLERFGMTEIGVGASNPLASEGRRPGMVGPPLPTVRTRIVSDDGRDGDTGELWIAGPSVFARYHERPDATRDAFVEDAGDRWFKTGDTVAREADGYLRILGRTSVDILKSGGYKLSALEIEESLREHAAVAEVAVVGMPDALWGDRVVACVVARAGRETECTEDALRGFAKERLAAYKVPKQVIVMTELPRNAVGKVVKPELIKRLS
jgi:malonyl-CoA/methylmalonyl-CoA synthetase